ncbi:MAG: ornithine carbamoyltransferase [Planctomycetota bacterium]
MRHLITMLEYSQAEFESLLEMAKKIKANLLKGKRPDYLPRRVLGLIFEKPSLRTRASFEASMAQMGGASIFLSASDGAIGKREPVADFARTLSNYVDAVVLRTFAHETIEEFAQNSSVPIINGLSDYLHPCQALADILTIHEELGSKPGKKVVFVGDGNNVSRSLAIACARSGFHFTLAGPKPYFFDKSFLEMYSRAFPKYPIEQTADANSAVKDADVVYADVWTSMGQEKEHQKRLKEFMPYQINEKLLKKAPARCKFMHCLPAHRGEEVTAAVIDGPQSIVFQEAGNRMHIQKAILCNLILNSFKV